MSRFAQSFYPGFVFFVLIPDIRGAFTGPLVLWSIIFSTKLPMIKVIDTFGMKEYDDTGIYRSMVRVYISFNVKIVPR